MTANVPLDLELVTRARDGDRQAFGELVWRYRERVINVVYRMCGNAELAEDAAQEAFVRAWQHLGRYRHRGTFHAWLCRIAINCALDHLRREKPTADIEVLPLEGREPGPEAQAARRELRERVRMAVLDLPPASRAALVLREYEGLSYREIAEALDIPLGTVMSRLNYARSTLREQLAAYMEAA